jgi:hypothetical protein
VSIGKSVPNLISYLHEVFQNFSQSLNICFELFSFGEFVYSEITDSGPHLTAASTASRPPDSRRALCAAAVADSARLAHLLTASRAPLSEDATPRCPSASERVAG